MHILPGKSFEGTVIDIKADFKLLIQKTRAVIKNGHFLSKLPVAVSAQSWHIVQGTGGVMATVSLQGVKMGYDTLSVKRNYGGPKRSN